MKKSKNSKAWIPVVVLILAVLIALPLGTARSLNRLREEAQSSYYYDMTGYAIYQGLETRQELAADLITLAEKYRQDYPQLESALDELDYNRAVAENFSWDPDDLGKERPYDRAMGEAAKTLAQALEELPLSEKDAKYPGQILSNMEAEADKLRRSSYNDDAREFNARLTGIPASLLKTLGLVKELPVYE